MIITPPSHPFTAFVLGVAVYAGDDADIACRVFEAGVKAKAETAGADTLGFSASEHTTPGYEERPVIEVRMHVNNDWLLLGALYGVTVEQWRARTKTRVQ